MVTLLGIHTVEMSAGSEDVTGLEEGEFSRSSVGWAGGGHLDSPRGRTLSHGDEHALCISRWLLGSPFHVVCYVDDFVLLVVVDEYDVGDETVAGIDPVSCIGFSVTLGVGDGLFSTVFAHADETCTDTSTTHAHSRTAGVVASTQKVG